MKKQSGLLFVVVILLFVKSVYCVEQPVVLNADLDGDGKQETITLVCNSQEYELKVNKTSFSGSGNCVDSATAKVTGDEPIKVIDIDASDHKLEIALLDSGASDDYSSILFEYVGGSKPALNKIGVVQGRVSTDGQRRLHGQERGSVLHTWRHPKAYVLDRNGQLHELRQELYPMGTRCKVKRPLPLHASRGDQRIVTVLQPGEEIVIVASDDEQWCFVSSKRVCGWFQTGIGSDFLIDVNSSSYEALDGLSGAD